MPPNIPGSLNTRALLRACWPTLFLLATLSPFFLPSHAEAALTRSTVGTYTSVGGHGTGSFITSSFTPPNNSLLVVRVSFTEGGDSGSTGSSLTLANSAGLAFTSRVTSSNEPGWSYGTQVWTAPVSNGSSMPLTVDAGAFDVHNWTGGPTIPTGKWFLAALVVEAGQATAYAYSADGLASAVNSVSHPASTLDDLKIGLDDVGGGREFKGKSDDVRIYNRALTAAEVKQLYKLGTVIIRQ